MALVVQREMPHLAAGDSNEAALGVLLKTRLNLGHTTQKLARLGQRHVEEVVPHIVQRHRVQVQPRHDAKVIPATLQAPVQVRVLVSIGIHDAPIPQHHLVVLDMVARQPRRANQRREAAAQDGPRGADPVVDTRHHAHGEGVHVLLHLADAVARADVRDFLVRVEAQRLEQRQVNHQAVGGAGAPGRVRVVAGGAHAEARLRQADDLDGHGDFDWVGRLDVAGCGEAARGGPGGQHFFLSIT